jgi:hypothetical protein
MTTSVCQKMIFLRMGFQIFLERKVAGEPFFLKVCESAPDVDKCILIFDKAGTDEK